jgi:hypothetical protein
MPKKFIAIGTGILNGKLVFINTSADKSIEDANGITFERALDFLFGLRDLKERNETTVFVCYAFSRDNEFIFSTMPNYLKDKLFKSEVVKRQLHVIESENETLDDILYTQSKETERYQIADFERNINKHSLAELHEVFYHGYNIKLVNGKSLILRKNGKVITFYDIYGFFKPAPLKKVAK